MRFVKSQGECNVSDLVDRYYGVKPSSKSGEAARVALLSANPFLKGIRKLPEGILISLPDVPETKPKEGAPPQNLPALRFVDLALASLGGIRKAVEGSF